MFLHLTFTNGSNPFVFYGPKTGDTTKADCMKELQRWKRRYDVIDQSEKDGGLYVLLQEKRTTGRTAENRAAAVSDQSNRGN